MLQVWKIGKSDPKEDHVVGINLYRNKISEEKEVDNDVLENQNQYQYQASWLRLFEARSSSKIRGEKRTS